MPTPKKYVSKDGTTTWRVRYRSPSGRSGSRTFHQHRDAAWFARQIEDRGVRFALTSLLRLEAETTGSSSPTLDAVAEEFFTWKARYVRSPRTVPDYRRQYDQSIRKPLGSTPVVDITPTLVGEWVEDMITGRINNARNGHTFSPKTIAGRSALLHSIMEYAANPRRAYVTANPCAGITLPKKVRPSPKGMMPAEWQALDAALRLVNPHAADLAEFMLSTGWRWGEASALPVAAVEDYGTQTWVTMMQVNRRGDHSKVVIVQDEGKAQASMRRVKLDPDTAATVRARVGTRAPGALVFTRDDEGNPWTYQRFEKTFQKAVEAANLTRRPTIHWLRHTHVAWLAMSGAALPQLQARIGHASITTTIGTYGSMINDVADDVLTRFAQIRSSRNDVARPLPPASPAERM